MAEYIERTEELMLAMNAYCPNCGAKMDGGAENAVD